VNADYCYQAVNNKDKKKVFGSIPLLYSFWDEFEYYELTINQRQNEDKVYGDLLGRIRLGNQTEEDISLLKTRVIPIIECLDVLENSVKHYSLLSKEKNGNVILIFPKVASVERANQLISKELSKLN